MILDGKKVRDELLNKYKKQIEEEKLKLCLAIIFVGDNKASEVYVNNKLKYCKYVGIDTKLIKLKEDTTEKEVIDVIKDLNNDKKVTGIILQSPVPKHIDINKCIEYINPKKDIDGFTKESLFNLAHNTDGLRPCTVKGIIELLNYYNIDLKGKNVCVIGRGDIVGKPLVLELLNHNATVSCVHSKTKNIKDYTKYSDIVISAAGYPNLVIKDMIKKNAIVLDVGINVIDGKIKGDVDFENVSKKCAYITPNPGGVGPMTIAMIIDNVIKASKGGK